MANLRWAWVYTLSDQNLKQFQNLKQLVLLYRAF